ncbi:TPA: hypothetical protein OOF39_004534 [Kluyvera ascorbata]|nr:hypothetical protein [Kluyvera ascorbata]
MKHNIKAVQNKTDLREVKGDAFYFLVILCVFFMSLTKLSSSDDSITIIILRGLYYFVLIFCVASYGAKFFVNALKYIKYKNNEDGDL